MEPETIQRFIEAVATVTDSDDWQNLCTELTGRVAFYGGNDPDGWATDALDALEDMAKEILRRQGEGSKCQT